ncbi:MAG: phosphotransferase family protein [Novosphingobium sp.]|nr:phosphotransferase family protein [Novosphingobium sp.]
MSWQWDNKTLARLTRFLSERGLADSTDIRPVPIGDGHSNLTYRLEGTIQPMVLRRPPPPPFPPGSNDVLREARILEALASTNVPVPPVFATAQEGEVLDVPFYLMAFVDGDIITKDMPSAYARPDRAEAMGYEQVDVIARLHAVDWQTIGLDDLGRPEGFNARHLKRISSLVRDKDGGLQPAFAPLHDWLAGNCPAESGAAIIHNDCRIGNVIWTPGDPPRIIAILDWELATIGDPLLDLAYLIASLPRDSAARQPVQDLATACLVDGFPDTAHLAARYADRTGAQLDNLGWYLAMVNWKLAALYAYSRRKGDDPYFDDDSHVARFLAEAAWHVANG